MYVPINESLLFCSNFIKRMDRMKKIVLAVKNLFSEDLINVIITIVLTALLELSRKALFFIFELKEKVDLDILKSCFNDETTFTVLNIILITLIVWGVTSLTRMLEKDNRGKRNKIHTSAMLVVFIVSLLWYIIEDLFLVNLTLIRTTAFICMMLLIVLTSYFVKIKRKSFSVDKFDSNNRIA